MQVPARYRNPPLLVGGPADSVCTVGTGVASLVIAFGLKVGTAEILIHPRPPNVRRLIAADYAGLLFIPGPLP